MLHFDKGHYPGQDVETILSAKEIEKDPSRMDGARQYIKSQQERFAKLEQDFPKAEKKRDSFLNAVHGSKMER